MGPDGKALNLALANGGMVIPVVYTDSLNIDAILESFTSAVKSIQPGANTNWPEDGSPVLAKAISDAAAAAADASHAPGHKAVSKSVDRSSGLSTAGAKGGGIFRRPSFVRTSPPAFGHLLSARRRGGSTGGGA
jgi:hypothetical protein